MNAWPALEQVLYDGWILRFSKGYSKRVNSINPLYPSTMALSEKVPHCEKTYNQKGLPPIFRLTPFFTPVELDSYLEGENYKVIDPTHVLVLHLQEANISPVEGVEVRDLKLGAWMEIFSCCIGSSLKELSTHMDIVRAIPSTCKLAALSYEGEAVACGRVVLEGTFAGFFSLVTHPLFRQQGFGKKLMLELLYQARENGTRLAYLQVMDSNKPALNLYEGIGFRELYSYWYRIR